jgi:hypothetical protein
MLTSSSRPRLLVLRAAIFTAPSRPHSARNASAVDSTIRPDSPGASVPNAASENEPGVRLLSSNEEVLMSTGSPPMFVTSTNSDPLDTGLYIHSVMATWPGTAAPAGVANANTTTLDAAIVSTAGRTRTRWMPMSGGSSERRCTRAVLPVNGRRTRPVRLSAGASTDRQRPTVRSARDGGGAARWVRWAVSERMSRPGIDRGYR